MLHIRTVCRISSQEDAVDFGVHKPSDSAQVPGFLWWMPFAQVHWTWQVERIYSAESRIANRTESLG